MSSQYDFFLRVPSFEFGSLPRPEIWFFTSFPTASLIPVVLSRRCPCPTGHVRRALVAGCLLLAFGLGEARAQTSSDLSAYSVTVAAAGLDRTASVVSFPVPTPSTTGAYHLEAPSGAAQPLQVGPRRAWFVVDSLAAGASRTYQIKAGRIPADSAVAQRRGRTVDISIDGAPVLRYWAKPRPVPPNVDSIYERGGYLHPVRTPSGHVVTGDYSPDHPHHHGLWSAWTKTRFRGRTPDFWNMGDGTGGVQTMALDSTWSGPVQAGLTARHRYVDRTGPAPVTALYETWTLRVYRVSTGKKHPDYRLFDLAVTQTTASNSPLILPEYRYGGVAVRGPDAWYGSDNARFLTSAGRDRSDGNRSRARWTYFGGTVEGRQAGIAMLGHPTNFRAPQPLRIPPDMPYFTFAPSQLGTWRISPGRPYEAHYRFVTVDGSPDSALLDRLWTDYAHPPTVTVHPAD